MIRLPILFLAFAALAGCETLQADLQRTFGTPAASTQSASAATPARPADPARYMTAEQQLIELERRLAAAAQDQGLGGALAPVVDPVDGFVMRPGVLYQGNSNVEIGLNAGSAGPIMWQPDRVFVADEGDMGVTSGRYVQVVPGAEAIQGRYLAVWRKDSSGEWRLLSESRVADPPRRR